MKSPSLIHANRRLGLLGWLAFALPINPEASAFYVFATEGTIIQMRKPSDEPLSFINFLRICIRKYNLS
jgi:hypothetical protein